jgi:uncharacterized protein YkwD
MTRRIHIVGIAVLLAAVAACSSPSSPDREPAPAPPGVTPPASVAPGELIEFTNRERARAGLSPLRTNARLTQAAEIQAGQVAAAGRLEHTLPQAAYPTLEDRMAAAGYAWRRVGENLAFGQRNAAAAVDTWMQSPGHRENILNDEFVDIGAGFVVDPNGRPYYVQVFARPAP